MDTKTRDYYFDNAKFILIILVVMAHGISKAEGWNPVVTTIWTFINMFHMPAFLFISGYFSKKAAAGGRADVQKLFTYMLYYAVAQIVSVLFDHFVLHDPEVTKSMLYAMSSLWFLQIIIVYHTLLPFLAGLKNSAVMIISLAAGMLIGFDAAVGHFLSIHRAFAFMPFFIAGYVFSPELMAKARQTGAAVRIGAGAFLAAVFAAIHFKLLNMPDMVFTGPFNYYRIAEDTGIAWYSAAMWRAAHYVIAGLMIAAFMLVIPRGKTFFSRFGARTLSVYILHRFLYVTSLEFGWVKNNVNSWGSFILLVLIIIAVTFILSLKPFDIPFKALRSIKLDRILNKEGK